jgi:hypothetical protein
VLVQLRIQTLYHHHPLVTCLLLLPPLRLLGLYVMNTNPTPPTPPTIAVATKVTPTTHHHHHPLLLPRRLSLFPRVCPWFFHLRPSPRVILLAWVDKQILTRSTTHVMKIPLLSCQLHVVIKPMYVCMTFIMFYIYSSPSFLSYCFQPLYVCRSRIMAINDFIPVTSSPIVHLPAVPCWKSVLISQNPWLYG